MSGRFRGAAMLLLMAALVWSAAPAEAGPDGQGRKGPGPNAILARLDLTAEQKARVKEIRETGQAETRSLAKAMTRLRHELQGEMLADEPDPANVRELAQQIGDIRTKQEIRRLETRLAVRQELTPEQREQLLLMEQRRARPERQGQGPRGPGRGGSNR